MKGGNLKRGNLRIETGHPDGDFWIERVGPIPEQSVFLSAAELRWLVQAAGPALLVEHAPLPTPAEIAQARRA